jgi:predicted RNase H-like HicB family nuclease
MKQHFTASIWREGDWYVAQCLEIDVASQGETEDEALSNLREALELYFEPPIPRSHCAHVQLLEAWSDQHLSSTLISAEG